MIRITIGRFMVALVLMTAGGCAANAQSDERVGNLLFKLPSGWKKEVRGNGVILRPPDAPVSRVCTVTIIDGFMIRGDFSTWAESQWNAVRGTRTEVRRVAIPVSKDSSGMEAMGFVAVIQLGNTPRQYHLFAAFRSGSVGGTLSFVTDGEDLLAKYEDNVKAIAGSIKYLSTPMGPAAAQPSAVSDSSGTASSMGPLSKQPPRTRPRDLPEKLPEPLAMPPGSPEMAAKILAQTIFEGGDQALPALMRAVLAAGHPIVKRDGTVLFSPAQGTSNGIGILDAEVVFAADSVNTRVTVSWGGIGSVVQMDPLFKGFDILPPWKAELGSMVKSPDAANRFSASFIKAIASESGGVYADPGAATSESPISPIQAHFFLLRSFGALHLARNLNTSLSDAPSNRDLNDFASGPISEPFDVLYFQGLSDRISMSDMRRAIARDPSGSNIFNAISELLRRSRGGAESEAWLIGVTQRIWTMNFLNLEVDDAQVPLVRKKVLGMRGEQREYPVRLILEIPSSAREHFESYARELGGSVLIPPNGQISFNADPGFRPVVEPLSARAAELIEIKSFDIPAGTGTLEPARLLVEGAPQQKSLPERPDEDPKTATIRISMRPLGISRPGPSRDRPTIWQIVSSEFQSSFKFDIPLQVTDWKGGYWTGSIMVQARGSGSWNSSDMESQAEWRIDRGFYTEFELDYKGSSGLIPGTVRTNPTARGPRQYTTSFPKRNPPVNLKYDDYIKLSGSELTCTPGFIREYSTTIIEARLRRPKGFNEEVLTWTHRGTMLQQEALEGVTTIQLWQDSPPVPVTERVEVSSYGSDSSRRDAPPPRPPTVTDKVVKLLNGIRINRARGVFIINNAVVKQTRTGLVIEDSIDDDFVLDLGLPRGATPPKVRVTIKWKFELAGGATTGALPNAIEQALAVASFIRELNRFLDTLPSDESSAMVKASFSDETVGVESCSLTNHRIAGKLRHQSKASGEFGSKK